jgi:hypothetical protein
MIAAGSNNAFAINGFTGFTISEIISFFIVFVIFNFYAMLMTVALAAFYVTAKPRHGRIRSAAIWHFVASLWVMLAFISTVWGAPAEKGFIQNTGSNLGIGQRAVMLFLGLGFAFVAMVCMSVGFTQGAKQKREIREAILATA